MNRFVVSLLFAFSLTTLLHADPPPGYYDDAEGLTGEALREELTQISALNHSVQGYDSSRDDMYEYVDDLDDNDMIEDAYTGEVRRIGCRSGCEFAAFEQDFSAEHSWPQSLYDERLPMRSDLHQLFPVLQSENSCRSNLPFNEPTVIESECYQPGDGSFRGDLNGVDVYEVRAEQRGDTARAMFYMITRYWDDENEFDSGGGPRDVSSAQIDLYLKWHREDPVDGDELLRHERIAEASVQGNRNPFVDRPEFVEYIWGDQSPTPTPTPIGSPTATPTPTPTPGPGGNVWVNELHYDNDGSDTNEGIEVAGTDLSDWSIELYNGNGNESYGTINLSGTLPDQENGFGTSWFPEVIQNGSPDGFALVDAAGNVVQFLSYEGTFTASGGPADGMTSTEIPVEETSNSPIGTSMQLQGEGNKYSDFTWATEITETRDEINEGQSFLPATPQTTLEGFVVQ